VSRSKRFLLVLLSAASIGAVGVVFIWADQVAALLAGLVGGVVGGVVVFLVLRRSTAPEQPIAALSRRDTTSRHSRRTETRPHGGAERQTVLSPASDGPTGIELMSRTVTRQVGPPPAELPPSRSSADTRLDAPHPAVAAYRSGPVVLVGLLNVEASCRLGGIPLGGAVLPVTSRASELVVATGGGEATFDLQSWAAPAPSGAVALSPAGKMSPLAVVSQANGVATVLVSEARDTAPLQELLDRLSVLALTGDSLRHHLSAVVLLASDLAGVPPRAVAVVVADDRGEVTLASYGRVDTGTRSGDVVDGDGGSSSIRVFGPHDPIYQIRVDFDTIVAVESATAPDSAKADQR